MKIFVIPILATLLASCSGTRTSGGGTSDYGDNGSHGTSQQQDLYRGGSK